MRRKLEPPQEQLIYISRPYSITYGYQRNKTWRCYGRMLWKIGRGAQRIRSSSVDWEEHLCSCSETIFKGNGELTAGLHLPISLWNMIYTLLVELLVQLTVRCT